MLLWEVSLKHFRSIDSFRESRAYDGLPIARDTTALTAEYVIEFLEDGIMPSSGPPCIVISYVLTSFTVKDLSEFIK